MSLNEIRKGVEKIIVDSIYPIKVDFKQDGLNEDKYVRISNPIAITEPLILGGGEYRHTCRVVVRIFSKSLTDTLTIFDSITNGFDLDNYTITHNGLNLHTTSYYTEYSGKDSTGSYYQLNAGIEFLVDTY